MAAIVNAGGSFTKRKVLLNADLGEGYGNFRIGPDEELLPLIDVANVACGFHAGDPLIMSTMVKACKKHNIKCGAHPGLPDLQGFGRREMHLEPEEFTAMATYQVGALKGFLDREGMPLHHVKPHGKLYGMMCKDYTVARAVIEGIPEGVPIFGLPGTNMEKAALDLGRPFWSELYGDVKYNDDGSLVIDRIKKPWTAEEIDNHVRPQVFEGTVQSVNNKTLTLPLKDYPISICCHSDSPGCLDIVENVRRILDENNAGL